MTRRALPCGSATMTVWVRTDLHARQRSCRLSPARGNSGLLDREVRPARGRIFQNPPRGRIEGEQPSLPVRVDAELDRDHYLIPFQDVVDRLLAAAHAVEPVVDQV